MEFNEFLKKANEGYKLIPIIKEIESFDREAIDIYSNHFDQVNIQLKRRPKSLPKIKINSSIDNIFKFTFNDFELVDYDPHPAIKAAVSV